MIAQTILLTALLLSLIVTIGSIIVLFKLRKKLSKLIPDTDYFKPSDKNSPNNVADFSKILEDIKKINERNKKH